MGLNEKILSIKPKDFKFLLKCGARYKGNDIKSLIYHPYKFVKSELPTMLSEGEFEQIFKRLGISPIIKINIAIEIILYIYDELKRIGEIEKEFLNSNPDPDMVNAGIETLNELGEFNLIDMLVKEWGVYTHEQIEMMPYHKIFDKQRKMKLEADIQRNLIKIQKDKSKRKI
jgi:hypothetical protein